MPALYTPILGLPYPVEADPADVPKDIQALADKLDTTVIPASDSRFHAPGDLIVSAAATRAGCLICDGAPVSRTTYAALFAAITTTYGNGDGSTTFNVPDYRGRAIVGAGAGNGLTNRNRGAYMGEEAHTLSTSELSVHTHGVYDPQHNHPISDGGHTHPDPGHGHGVTDNGHTHMGGNGWNIVSSFAGVSINHSDGSGGVPVLAGNGPIVTGGTTLQAANIGINGGYTGLQAAATGVTAGYAVSRISNYNEGGGAGHNNMQPSAVANVFIKT